MLDHAFDLSLTTFYFGRYANPLIARNLFYTVRISCSAPKFYVPYDVDDSLDSVYPMGLVGGNLDRETFKTLYRKRLDSNEELIKFQLNIIGGLAWHKKKYPLFLCFENLLDGKSFCHREFLAEWILEKKIANVEEIHDTM